MLFWDVNSGINRRAWANNDNANFQIRRAMEDNPLLNVTLANFCDPKILDQACGNLSTL